MVMIGLEVVVVSSSLPFTDNILTLALRVWLNPFTKDFGTEVEVRQDRNFSYYPSYYSLR